MTIQTEQDILSIPTVLRQTYDRVRERRASIDPFLRGPVAFLGCGSSYCIALAAASLYESTRDEPAQGIMGSEYQLRSDWNHVAITRTSKTTELVNAMQRIRAANGRLALVRGEAASPAEEQADVVLPLEFAPERGVIQTRFIAAALFALRLLIGGEETFHSLADLPEHVEQALARFDPEPLIRYKRVVYLGRGWRYGLAAMAALNLQETTLTVPEAHQTLEYRHGPIAAADQETLVWCFDDPEDELSTAVREDARNTGALVYCPPEDPMVSATVAFLFAVRMAAAHGINPDAPRNLSRFIALPSENDQ